MISIAINRKISKTPVTISSRVTSSRTSSIISCPETVPDFADNDDFSHFRFQPFSVPNWRRFRPIDIHSLGQTYLKSNFGVKIYRTVLFCWTIHMTIKWKAFFYTLFWNSQSFSITKDSSRLLFLFIVSLHLHFDKAAMPYIKTSNA